MRHRYLCPSLSLPEIYLCRAPVDFRKQAQGLAVLVEQELGHNPFTGGLYALTNRQRNKIKCLVWENSPSSGYHSLTGLVTSIQPLQPAYIPTGQVHCLENPGVKV